ncbi:FUSC family protein [Agrobacterium sp. ES01]|uniref:FUSC family protein n=1 Tax=Agrobacterium sp. ES01 TaxID=3420714 RepID=UPI003D118E45
MSGPDRNKHAGTPPERVRGLARWLELRAIALTPEHLHLEDGIRAAFIVAVPLLVVVATGQSHFGWAIFAAFWTCLADTGGPERRRRGLLMGFVALGSMAALIGSFLAGYGIVFALSVGPVLVTITALLPLRWPASTMVATLVGVVAVVAAGYPLPAAGAAMLALTFFCGGSWAAIILTIVWRTDRWLPARQAIAAVYARLGDMATDIAEAQGADQMDPRRSTHSQHRRAVRMAIERATGLLDQNAIADDAKSNGLDEALAIADSVFHGLLALDHLRLTNQLDADLRAALNAIAPLLAQARKTIVDRSTDIKAVEQRARMLAQMLPAQHGAGTRAIHAIAAAFKHEDDDASVALSGSRMQAADSGQSRRVLQTAVRSGVGVAVVTLVAHLLSLTYPYWATMAIIVVLQPGPRMSWSRSLERILGSSAGGVLALAILSAPIGYTFLIALVITIAAATIAVRSVNYTLFVVFLTLLFVLVMDILSPGEGIASARILDNVLGSVVAILVTLIVWPNREASVSSLVAEAVHANQAYLDAVGSGDARLIAPARRDAGLASTEAEIAMHASDRIIRRRSTEEDKTAIIAARQLAGEAAALWYSNHELPKPGGDAPSITSPGDSRP